MLKIIIPIIFTIVALALFAGALHFAKYKKRPSGCCGAHEVCHHHKDKDDAEEK